VSRRTMHHLPYSTLLDELGFKVPVICRYQCPRCLIPVGDILVRGKHVRVNVDGSRHWRSCKSR
jgi:hypothetical protein